MKKSLIFQDRSITTHFQNNRLYDRHLLALNGIYRGSSRSRGRDEEYSFNKSKVQEFIRHQRNHLATSNNEAYSIVHVIKLVKHKTIEKRNKELVSELSRISRRKQKLSAIDPETIQKEILMKNNRIKGSLIQAKGKYKQIMDANMKLSKRLSEQYVICNPKKTENPN